MQIKGEIQSLSPSALIELFSLDLTQFPGGNVAYFHAGLNEIQQPVVWQGVQYVPLPIEVEGFDITAKGALPRPRVRVANINGLFSAEVKAHDDLIGCRLIRRRTFARFLDAVNFTSGENPEADPSQHFPDDIWFVNQKLSENKYIIEFELASAFDLQGVKLPYRQVIQNSCVWKYRGPECGYTGAARDKDGEFCSSDKDFCAKRLADCRARFGDLLPYGGFPGAVRHDM
jgi:lambda family phage minor tail protein L